MTPLPSRYPAPHFYFSRNFVDFHFLFLGDLAMGVQEDEVIATVDRIRPLLAGRSPEVQGAILADLLAIWVAGHSPQLRQGLLDMHIDMVRELIPLNAKIIRGLRDAEREGSRRRARA